jgi:hypothetical protein
VKRRVTSKVSALVALGFVLVAPLFASSCQSIANIEDRTLGQCGEFCDTVMKNCANENLVYQTRAKCMSMCALLDIGDTEEPEGTNTLQCRLKEAQAAASAPTEHCRSAGPEGLACGGSCESYCTYYERACGVIQCGSHENCVAKCAALRNNGEYNIEADHDGNTLQCRLVHVTNASTDPNAAKDDNEHCGHSLLTTPKEYCTDRAELTSSGAGGAGGMTEGPERITEPDCSEYCRVEGIACPKGPNAMYENASQCAAVCKVFAADETWRGTLADTKENTLGCRLYHSYNSLCGGDFHCPHAGPTGEGHCGSPADGKCEAYCFLASRVCSASFASAFVDEADCVDQCHALPDAAANDLADSGTRYNVNYAATPGTLACRVLAASRAAEATAKSGSGAEPSQCTSVFGDGDCATP